MTSIIKVDQIQTLAGTAPTAADLGINVTGSVLQTLQAVNTTEYTVGSGSGNLTNLSVTITPRSATSKFILSANIGVWGWVANGATIIFSFKRNSTPLSIANNGTLTGFTGGIWNDSNISPPNAFMMYMDSPNTTSAITYYVTYACDGTITIGRRGGDLYMRTSQGLIVQEIAG
jgi:hypothetical protein